jgi:hypothetical protein
MRARSIGLFMVMGVLALAASIQVGLAQEPGPGVGAPITEVDGCMQDLAGFDLNCRANDVQIAGVALDEYGEPLLEILDDGCAYPGDTVDFVATFEVLLTAQARHDIGIYFATDGDTNGDGAVSGSCSISTVPWAYDPPWLDLDGTDDPWPGTNDASGLQDVCGDIDADHNPLYPEIALYGVACVDDDGDGYLNLPNCTSWRQPGANEYCEGPLSAYPGSPSKCRCDTGFNVPIEVPPAELDVEKTADPTSVYEPGDAVTFTVTITNSGIDPNNPVTLTSLEDDIYGDITTDGHDGIQSTTCALVTIPAGNVSGNPYICSFAATVTGNAGDVETDTVTAEGTDDHGNPIDGYDDAEVTILDVPPTATLTKTADPITVPEPGANVTFTVRVDNDSTAEALTLDKLDDDIYGDITYVHDDIASTTCSVTQTIAVGGYYECEFVGFVGGNAGDAQIDTVTADVSDNDGNTIHPYDDATVTVTDVPPTATLTKTADPITVPEPGANVTFTVRVDNTSTAEALTLDKLDDDIYGDITSVHDDIVSTTCSVTQTIAVGGHYECQFVGFVGDDAGDVQTDTVTADVSDNDGNTIHPYDDAMVTVTDVPPSASLTKTPDEVVVKFEVVVYNDSTAEALTLDKLDDDIYGDITYVHDDILSTTCSVTQTIAIGGHYTCHFTAVVTTSPQTDTVTGDVSDNDGNTIYPWDWAWLEFGDPPE